MAIRKLYLLFQNSIFCNNFLPISYIINVRIIILIKNKEGVLGAITKFATAPAICADAQIAIVIKKALKRQNRGYYGK